MASRTTGPACRPGEWRHALPRFVSESTRQRETFRYDPSLPSRIQINTTGVCLPSSELSPSQDSVLTALAQLTVWHTGTDRSLVSLFDQDYTYFIAEATATLPLVPLPSQQSQGLLVCGTAIPRSHSICEYTLLSRDPSEFEYCREDKRQLPVLVIPDVSKDPRFRGGPYCQPNGPASFYAAAPIRTQRGINIGVLSVLSPEPDVPWSERHSQVLRNLAVTVMSHLDANRSKTAHRRSERMVRGLGYFVEGKSMSSSWDMEPGASFTEITQDDEAARWAVREMFFRAQERLKLFKVDDSAAEKGLYNKERKPLKREEKRWVREEDEKVEKKEVKRWVREEEGKGEKKEVKRWVREEEGKVEKKEVKRWVREEVEEKPKTEVKRWERIEEVSNTTETKGPKSEESKEERKVREEETGNQKEKPKAKVKTKAKAKGGAAATVSPRSHSPTSVNGDLDLFSPFEHPHNLHGSLGSPGEEVEEKGWQETASGSSNPMREIFSEAANIIRESLETDGCLFLDATLTSLGAFDKGHNSSNNSNNYRRHHPRNQQGPKKLNEQGQLVSECADEGEEEEEEEEEEFLSQSKEQWPPCQVLGISRVGMSDTDKSEDADHGIDMAQKFLAKLLHRYPRGHIFSFDANGDLQSSDSSDDDGWLEPALPQALGLNQPAGPQAKAPKPRKPWARQNEGRAILEVFPGSRSVAFVPVWDPRKQRWCAGGFVYTSAATRIFTVEAELNYLRAFGIMAIAETLRMKTQAANQAKSDALGSLSHELRSPLHGAVLGIELLRDTELSVFQGNVAHTIETCCRTLVDTVDHLLDYSKVNRFMQSQRKGGAEPRGLRQSQNRTVEEGMLSLYKHIKLDDIVEEVMDGVYAGYNFQHMSVTQLSHQHKARPHSDLSAIRRLDTMQAMEELGPTMNTTTTTTSSGEGEAYGESAWLKFGGVSVYLDIDPSVSWRFYTQPGAIRRLVMNLFGNALKYTVEGTIKISLVQHSANYRPKHRRHHNRINQQQQAKAGAVTPTMMEAVEAVEATETMVSLIVADTGKGISEDYLRNELYKPFSQEDHLAPGTGLGLSFVKQITSQLRGQVTVESKVGVGTTVRVTLPLNRTMASASASGLIAPTDYEREYEKQLQELSGQGILLVGFENAAQTPGADRPLLDGSRVCPREIVESVCRDWLGLRLVTEEEARLKAPDIVLWDEDSITSSLVQEAILAGAPCVVVCSNAMVAYKNAAHFESIRGGGIFEFLSPPIGPHKLSKALSLALKRFKDSPGQRFPLSPLSPRSHSIASMMPGYGFHQDHHYHHGGGTKSSSMSFSSASSSSTSSAVSASTAMSERSAPSTPETEEPEPEFLLVEDNDINLNILSIYMKKLGRTFRTASNGQEAVDAYRARPQQCKYIFMDISMPVMDGFEATRRIRAYEREKGMKPSTIFALTGLASEGAQQEAFGSGVDLFLTKPVKLKELGAILKSRGLVPA